MRSAVIGATLAGIFLFPAVGAQAQGDGRNAAAAAQETSSAVLDWMARTYKFTQAEVHSTRFSVYKRETDATLTHQGCRLTLREKDMVFDSSVSARADTSEWKRVIDLGSLDPASIQLKRVSDSEKAAYFALEFATSGGYKNIELFFADEARPATFSNGLIPLLVDPSDYAPRFADAFRRSVELCAAKR